MRHFYLSPSERAAAHLGLNFLNPVYPALWGFYPYPRRDRQPLEAFAGLSNVPSPFYTLPYGQQVPF